MSCLTDAADSHNKIWKRVKSRQFSLIINLILIIKVMKFFDRFPGELNQDFRDNI